MKSAMILKWQSTALEFLSPSVHASDGETDSSADSADHPDSDRFLSHEDRRNENARRLFEQRWNRYRRDHHKACGGISKPACVESFNSLGLPTEIRYRIYDMILTREVDVKQDSRGSNGPVDLCIFAVNRQIQAEAVEVLYRVTTFAV